MLFRPFVVSLLLLIFLVTNSFAGSSRKITLPAAVWNLAFIFKGDWQPGNSLTRLRYIDLTNVSSSPVTGIKVYGTIFQNRIGVNPSGCSNLSISYDPGYTPMSVTAFGSGSVKSTKPVATLQPGEVTSVNQTITYKPNATMSLGPTYWCSFYGNILTEIEIDGEDGAIVATVRDMVELGAPIDTTYGDGTKVRVFESFPVLGGRAF